MPDLASPTLTEEVGPPIDTSDLEAYNAQSPETSDLEGYNAQQDAISAINGHISGAHPLDRDTLVKMSAIARGPDTLAHQWERAGDWWTTFGRQFGNMIINPVGTVAPLAMQAAKGLGEMAWEQTGLPADIRHVKTAIEGYQKGGTQGAVDALRDYNDNQDAAPIDIPAGAVSGVAKMAGPAAGAVRTIADLTGLGSAGQDAGLYQFEHDLNQYTQKAAEAVGAHPETASFKGGEQIGPLAVPLGGEAGLAKTTAKIAEGAVEGAPKLVGGALKAGAKTTETIAPIIASGELFSHGHPIAAAANLLARYAPDSIPWVGKAKRFILDNTVGAVNDLGNTLAKTPYGQTVLGNLADQTTNDALTIQRRIEQEMGRIKDPDDLARLNDPIYPNDDPRLSPQAKAIRNDQAKLNDLNAKADKLYHYAKVNEVLSKGAKIGTQSVLNLGTASLLGAMFTSAGAPPGDTEAEKRGAEFGFALGVPGLYGANVSGRLGMGRDALINSGKDNVFGIDKVPEDQVDHVHAVAGFVKPTGASVHILTPEEMIAGQGAGMESEGSKAANGFYDPNTNQIFLNSEALGSGVAGHEATHAIYQAIGENSPLGTMVRNGLVSDNPRDRALSHNFLNTYLDRLQASRPDIKSLPLNTLADEAIAELGRDILHSTPPEQFYGGKPLGTMAYDALSNLKSRISGNRPEGLSPLDSSYIGAVESAGARRELTGELYNVGARAKQNKPIQANIEGAPLPSQQTGKSNVVAGTTGAGMATIRPEHEPVISAMRALGLSKETAQERVRAAADELGPNATVEAVAKRAFQKNVPQPISLMPSTRDAIHSPAVDTEEGLAFHGFTHDDAEAAAKEFGMTPQNRGFVTKTGRFLNEDEALTHGQDIGQIPGDLSSLKDFDFHGARQFMPSDLAPSGTENAGQRDNLLSAGTPKANNLVNANLPRYMPSGNPNAIRQAAILTDKGDIYTGEFHGVAYAKAKEAGYNGPVTRGYITNNGHFLRPLAAETRAADMGQIQYDSGEGLESQDFNATRRFMPSEEPQTPEFKKWSGDARVVLNAGPGDIPSKLFKVSKDEYGYIVHPVDPKHPEVVYGAMRLPSIDDVRDYVGDKGTDLVTSHGAEASFKRGEAVLIKSEGQPAEKFKTGESVVVGAYHGTPSGKFTVFDAGMSGSYTGAPSAKEGFFFSGNPETAQTYAEDSSFSMMNVNPHLHEVYIKFQNPYVHDFKGEHYREKSYYDLIKQAKSKGHDGVIFTNTFDGANQPDNIFVVFNNRNIKSTDNAGTFDPTNPDIRYMPASEKAAKSAEDYVKTSGIGKIVSPSGAKVDINRAKEIGQAYQDLPKTDNSPETKASYEALRNETEAQYKHAKDSGINFIHTEFDPYPNSQAMVEDVNNGNLRVFKGGEDHPFLGSSTVDENGLTANDKFRAVHDLYGHASEGNQFGPQGEERAWMKHSAMFSDLARPAMTAETRGQNSWVNYGPHMWNEEGWKGNKNNSEYIAPQNRPFAEQKASLLPNQFNFMPSDKSSTQLNIGLATDDGMGITPEEAMAAIKSTGANITRSDVHQSDTEPTLVASIDRPLTPDEAHKVSQDLKQGSIAQYNKGRGELYGPKAEDWRPFNPDLFITHEGVPLSSKYMPSDLPKATSQDKIGAIQEGMEPWEIRLKALLDKDQAAVNKGESVTPAEEAETDQLMQQAIQKSGSFDNWYKSIGGKQYNANNLFFMPSNWDEVSQHLTPEERDSINEQGAQKIINHFDKLPSVEAGAKQALSGQVKKNWYTDSARAITSFFGPDADRFTALLAALSPQVDVPTNLSNALNVFADWLESGRPTDKDTIQDIVARSVQQGKAGAEGKSALGAWVNNAIRSLSADDPSPSNLTLSGPKVDSFYKNLRDVTNEVTQDRWMSYYGWGHKNPFRPRSTTDVSGVTPKRSTKGFDYLALNAHIRQIADHLTTTTGEQWTPAETQAAIWSHVRTLSQLAEERGLTPDQILLTPEDIGQTEDFSTLLKEPLNQPVLQRIGSEIAPNFLPKPTEPPPSQPKTKTPKDVTLKRDSTGKIIGFRINEE